MNSLNGYTSAELVALPLRFSEGLFEGKVVVISGGGRGIGRALAFQFVRLGASVALLGRDEDRLNATAESLRAIGGKVFAVPASIRDPEQVDRFMSDAWDHFGGIDILVNNAGGQFPQAAIDFSTKGWNAVIDTNLNGTWYMTQAAGRRWRDAGRPGVVISIAAVVSRGMPGVAHSCAARAAVISLSQTLAIEWAPLNIRLNCVAPGIIATEGMGVYSEAARAELPKSNLMQRFGSVTDITDAVCYLAGPSGSFITGEVLTVDGGYQLWGDQWTIERPEYFSK
ncbi:MAG: SDR family oxidoreductase [Pseudomonadota bacterium]